MLIHVTDPGIKTALTVAGATLGFFAKTGVEWLKARAASRANSKASLRKLLANVDEGRSLYYTQSYLAVQLYKSISANHPETILGLTGYDHVFRAAYEHFTPDELEIHAHLRSLTEHSVFRVNDSLRSWLDQNLAEIQRATSPVSRVQLLEDLRQMRAHLNDWFAQYYASFQSDPKRAVNFVSSWLIRGTRFPAQLLDRLLHELHER